MATASSSTAAAWAARGVTAFGIVQALATIFRWELSEDQIQAISYVFTAGTVAAWLAYEKFHASGVAHTQQLADTLKANDIPVPPPANKDVK